MQKAHLEVLGKILSKGKAASSGLLSSYPHSPPSSSQSPGHMWFQPIIREGLGGGTKCTSSFDALPPKEQQVEAPASPQTYF